jgi:hypothetical protein
MPQAGHGRSAKRAPGTTTPRIPLPIVGLGALLALLILLPLGHAAIPNDSKPGQRIDMRVLLLSADGEEPGFEAWKAALDREGVPYDTFVAYTGDTKTATLTDDRLADYGANRAKYQAVILASGDLGRHQTNRNQTVSYLSSLSDAEWATLDRFERTFGIRRLSDFTAPSPIHGLQLVNGIKQDGRTGTLTDAGKKLFPYLKGPIPIPDDAPTQDEAFGYEGTPVNPADWQTLVAAPTLGAAYLGIYTRPDDGREEMVMTLGSNQYQSHNQALRHGMLTWVTRGVFLGYQRSYLGLDVDDIFLPDDKWDAAANVTDYRPEVAIRMTPADVDAAIAWQNRTGLKLNMVYNMAGADEFAAPPGNDALLARFRTVKNQFRWINHTLSHPNLDCTSAAFTEFQLEENQRRFNLLLGPVAAGLNDPSEAITGEHSGLANVRPGNPGTIDPPTFDELESTTAAAGTLAGSYEYAITARSPAGETVASIASVTLEPGDNAVRAHFTDVCHAIEFRLYRRPAGGNWVLVGTQARPAREPVDNGSLLDVRSILDTGGSSAGVPPTVNGAALAPYTQNPAYVPALTAAGIRTVASDSSKPYPNPPDKPSISETDPTNFAKGASFPLSATIRAIPRYPSNVYYNVANRADQLDEYNWIYTAPSGGGACVPIENVTTCNPAPVDWTYYLTSETRIMFGHLMGNDPRPHYFHQTNIAQADLTKPATDTSVGGTLYAVVDTLLARYEQIFDRASVPLLQLSQQQVADTLAQQDTWNASRGSATLSAYLLNGQVHVVNSGAAAVRVPLTGTTEGDVYGGQRSGWITVEPGSERVLDAPELAKSPPQATQPAGQQGKPKKKAKRKQLALSKLKMSPKRFAVAHKRKRRGTRLDGSTITWRLNRPATVRLKFQRAKKVSRKHTRWRTVGTITRRARAGTGVVRFRGRFHGKLLKPGRYRVVVTAQRSLARTEPKRVPFRVVKG